VYIFVAFIASPHMNVLVLVFPRWRTACLLAAVSSAAVVPVRASRSQVLKLLDNSTSGIVEPDEGVASPSSRSTGQYCTNIAPMCD